MAPRLIRRPHRPCDDAYPSVGSRRSCVRLGAGVSVLAWRMRPTYTGLSVCECDSNALVRMIRRRSKTVYMQKSRTPTYLAPGLVLRLPNANAANAHAEHPGPASQSHGQVVRPPLDAIQQTRRELIAHRRTRAQSRGTALRTRRRRRACRPRHTCHALTCRAGPAGPRVRLSAHPPCRVRRALAAHPTPDAPPEGRPYMSNEATRRPGARARAPPPPPPLARARSRSVRAWALTWARPPRSRGSPPARGALPSAGPRPPARP